MLFNCYQLATCLERYLACFELEYSQISTRVSHVFTLSLELSLFEWKNPGNAFLLFLKRKKKHLEEKSFGKSFCFFDTALSSDRNLKLWKWYCGTSEVGVEAPQFESLYTVPFSVFTIAQVLHDLEQVVDHFWNPLEFLLHEWWTMEFCCGFGASVSFHMHMRW